MFLTRILLAKAKSKAVVVVLESTVSGHKRCFVRDRVADKAEVIRFDPYVQMECVYKEIKKVGSLRLEKRIHSKSKG